LELERLNLSENAKKKRLGEELNLNATQYGMLIDRRIKNIRAMNKLASVDAG
jgi:hypothetical protein